MPHTRDPKRCKYSKRKARYVQILYILSILFWCAIIYFLQLYRTDLIGWIILLFPIFIFLLGLLSASQLCPQVEEDMFRANFLSLGLIVVVPLFTLLDKNYGGDKRQFSLIVIVAVMLTMFSLIDIWVAPKWVSLVKHLKSISQTSAVFLLIYALYIYFKNSFGTVLS